MRSKMADNPERTAPMKNSGRSTSNLGKLAGTVVAALSLGVVNKFLEPVAGAVLGKIFVLGFLILFIQRRPQGIFAVKGRAAEF